MEEEPNHVVSAENGAKEGAREEVIKNKLLQCSTDHKFKGCKKRPVVQIVQGSETENNEYNIDTRTAELVSNSSSSKENYQSLKHFIRSANAG